MSSYKNISIEEILNHIFRIRYILSLIIVLGILSGVYLILNNENKWKLTVNLQKIDKITLQEYNYLQEVNSSVLRSFHEIGNNLFSESGQTIEYDQIEIHQFVKSYDDEFIALLMDAISNKHLILNVLDEIKILDRNDFNSSDLYNDELNSIAISFRTFLPITTPTDKAIYKRDYSPYWKITFVSKNKIRAKETIEKAITKANLHVQELMQKKIEEYLNLIKLPYEEKILMLEAKKSLLINQYDMSRENTITFLTEQAILARSVGNEKNVEKSQMTAINIYPMIDPKGYLEGDDYYLRGYEFIETQIELLKNRDDDFMAYIPELISIESLILAYAELRDRNLAKLQDAFTSTPIFTNNFSSVNYDTGKVKYDRVSPSSLILFIFSLLVSLSFCMLLFITSFILTFYRKKISD